MPRVDDTPQLDKGLLDLIGGAPQVDPEQLEEVQLAQPAEEVTEELPVANRAHVERLLLEAQGDPVAKLTDDLGAQELLVLSARRIFLGTDQIDGPQPAQLCQRLQSVEIHLRQQLTDRRRLLEA